jgi:hypothetical protein
MVIAAGSRTWSCRQFEECNEGWDSVEHTFSAVVSSAADNSAGGFDYLIASRGMPGLLLPCTPTVIPGVPTFPGMPPFFNSSFGCDQTNGGDIGFNFANQLFPSVTTSNPGGSAWQGTGRHAAPIWTGTMGPFSGGPIVANNGIATFEGGGACSLFGNPFPIFVPGFDNFGGCQLFTGGLGVWVGNPNLGTTTTAVVDGYTCADNGPFTNPDNTIDPPICDEGTSSSGRGLGGSFELENMLLAISTNSTGAIISIGGFAVNEYCILNGAFTFPCDDSWDAGTFIGSGISAASAQSPATVNVDKRGGAPIVIFGSADIDVSKIDPASLQLGPGEFYFLGGAQRGGLKHNGHIGDENSDNYDDLLGHYVISDSDLACGTNIVPLLGEYDGVPFTTSVEITGVGKNCD